MIQLEQISPEKIEQRSFEIIEQELGGITLDPLQAPIIKRCIHTSADFDYVQNLVFSPHAVERAHQALKNGACIVTDTQMAKAGINKTALAKLGCETFCFMADEDVARTAKAQGTTRAIASMDKAATLGRPTIFAIGNAPTALVRLCELMEHGLTPALIIGAPVGFVNVVEAKELLLRSHIPHIVARGRKGGSTIAAAICNALLYSIVDRE